MPTEVEAVELERGVVHYIRGRQRPGESLSDVLRRVLHLPREIDRAGALLGEGFREQPTIIRRLLWVLRSLYLEDPRRFENAVEIHGRSRVYFARTRGAIQANGTHTYPRRIPDTPFWICSNFNERQKMAVLHKVLERMGYTRDERWRVVNAVLR